MTDKPSSADSENLHGRFVKNWVARVAEVGDIGYSLRTDSTTSKKPINALERRTDSFLSLLGLWPCMSAEFP